MRVPAHHRQPEEEQRRYKCKGRRVVSGLAHRCVHPIRVGRDRHADQNENVVGQRFEGQGV